MKLIARGKGHLHRLRVVVFNGKNLRRLVRGAADDDRASSGTEIGHQPRRTVEAQTRMARGHVGGDIGDVVIAQHESADLNAFRLRGKPERPSDHAAALGPPPSPGFGAGSTGGR